MDSPRSPVGRRANPGPRIHLTPPRRQKNYPRPKKILAKRSGDLRSRRMILTVKTRNGHRVTAVASRFSSLPTAPSPLFTSSTPLFPRNPFFPRLWSSHELSQRPSPQKQIPSNHSARSITSRTTRQRVSSASARKNHTGFLVTGIIVMTIPVTSSGGLESPAINEILTKHARQTRPTGVKSAPGSPHSAVRSVTFVGGLAAAFPGVLSDTIAATCLPADYRHN